MMRAQYSVQHRLAPILLLLLVINIYLQAPLVVSAAWARPPTKPVHESDREHHTHPVEVAVAAAASLVPPTVPQKLPYLLAAFVLASADNLVEHFFNETHRLELKHEKGNYKRTLLYAAAESIDVGAKAYGLTVGLDIVQTIFPALKQILPFQANLWDAAPHMGVMIWTVKSISTIKHLILNKLVYGTRLGKLAFFDRITDLGLGIAAGYNALSILQYEMGVSLNSFFAASGVSAIVVSLASKGMIEQMVGGLLLQAWDAVEVGEHVRLGDGTEGVIVRIGLVETEVLGSDDNVPIRVPNSQIIGKRVHMFSKVSTSKVKQTLRFKYGDLHKLPKIITDIKEEIQMACAEKMLGEPDVLLTNYESDHIQVSVSCSFDFKPDSKEYADTRQRALFAIAAAIKKNNVEFALPAIQYETKSGSIHPVMQGT